jgi:hypothetical protein
MTLEKWIIGCIGLGLCAAQVHSTGSQNVADFQKRVADYMKVRNQALSAVPSLKSSDSMGKIDAHEHDLQVCIKAVRPKATQGDIFTPAIAAEFRHAIHAALSGPGEEDAKKNLNENQPAPLPALAVNAAYPAEAPVPYMPPALLKALPPLPKELEYRVVGRALILRDSAANLIVDYIHDALP